MKPKARLVPLLGCSEDVELEWRDGDKRHVRTRLPPTGWPVMGISEGLLCSLVTRWRLGGVAGVGGVGCEICISN
jgi:hypothetical protein